MSIKDNTGFLADNCENRTLKMFKNKFKQKILHWWAMSKAGVTQSFMTFTKGYAMKQQIYIKQCLP